MRIVDSSRLSEIRITKFSLNYLHYLSLHRDVLCAIDLYAKGKVLDIGCGNKPSEYIGCDIVQSSQQKADIICDATSIPLPSNDFDTIFSTQTIEHVSEHQKVINEAYRLLKPNGYLILSGPLYWPLHEEPNDYFRFTKYGFEHILTKAGFKIEKIFENGGMWATSGQSIIHSLVNSNTKFLPVRIWRFLFFKLKILWLHNLIFSWLDKVDYNTSMTMNYVIVAKK
jgi:SAM-dependent methyltransferase